VETTTQGFRLGHAADADWETLTDACLRQIGDVPRGANLGFLYVTDMLDDDFPQIEERLRRATGVENWVGTIGLGVMAGGHEYFEKPAMVAMLGAMPADSFRPMPSVARPGDAFSDELMNWVGRANPGFGVVHADPRNPYVLDILNSITDDTDAFLVGGLTSSRGRYSQLSAGLAEGGVSGVLFSEDVSVVTGLSQGCSPVGDIHTVTRAQGNVLAELDGRPAFEVFRGDIGEVLARNVDRIPLYIHAALPVAGDDGGDYMVRNVVGIDAEKGLVAIGDRVAAGDRILFVRRDVPSASKDLDRMLADVTGRAETKPRAALYYSCVARGPNLFGPNSEELSAVRDAIGADVPVVGFFANGEISRNRLYGYTGVLTLFL
jgi:small ligand-binding sensory domain FIST